MKQRKENKWKSRSQYKSRNVDIRFKVCEAKGIWLSEKCQEIEELQKQNTTFSTYEGERMY